MAVTIQLLEQIETRKSEKQLDQGKDGDNRSRAVDKWCTLLLVGEFVKLGDSQLDGIDNLVYSS